MRHLRGIISDDVELAREAVEIRILSDYADDELRTAVAGDQWQQLAGASDFCARQAEIVAREDAVRGRWFPRAARAYCATAGPPSFLVWTPSGKSVRRWGFTPAIEADAIAKIQAAHEHPKRAPHAACMAAEPDANTLIVPKYVKIGAEVDKWGE